MAITKIETTEQGTKVVTAIARGVEYHIYELCGQWWCSSHRLALGKMHIGGGKYYKTLGEAAEKCKAFGGINELMKSFYGVNFDQEIA